MPPGYGVSTSIEGTVPWSHAHTRLEQAKIYWISTTRPDGRPHVTPVWGVWLDTTLYFDGHPQTRRVRNIVANPAVAVHLESGGAGKDVVIVEGNAYPMESPDRALTTRLAAAYTAKYVEDRYAPTPDSWDAGGLYAMRPRVVFAWGANLGETATRWRFGEGS